MKKIVFRISMLLSSLALLIIPLIIIVYLLLLFPLFAVLFLICSDVFSAALLEKYKNSFPIINSQD